MYANHVSLKGLKYQNDQTFFQNLTANDLDSDYKS